MFQLMAFIRSSMQLRYVILAVIPAAINFVIGTVFSSCLIVQKGLTAFLKWF